jgi:hypothetical protein
LLKIFCTISHRFATPPWQCSRQMQSLPFGCQAFSHYLMEAAAAGQTGLPTKPHLAVTFRPRLSQRKAGTMGPPPIKQRIHTDQPYLAVSFCLIYSHGCSRQMDHLITHLVA